MRGEGINEIHVRPLFGKEHSVEGRCWCYPRIATPEDADADILIHEAMN